MLYIPILAVVLAVSSGANGESMTPVQFGMLMSSRAYEAVCWYENQKNFPKTDTKTFNKCTTQSEQIKNQILALDVNQQQEYFGKWMPDTMPKIPSEYSNCNNYLSSAASDTSDNESETLNDQGNVYPFRAFAYCLMKTLRQKHGEEAIKSVKEERIYGRWAVQKVLLERENAFRALHGAPAMVPERTLMERAQKWSEKSAANCDDEHITKADPEYFLNGKPTGENLAAGTTMKKEGEKADKGYSAANGWYEEIKNYNWNGGPHRGTTGHFTQTVWNDHKYVGYGYAYNPKCAGGRGKWFITARYFPAGNMQGAFEENVKPPKK